MLCVFIFTYLIGIILSLFLNLDITNSLYSPFVLMTYGSFSFAKVFHCLLYFYIFPIIGLLFASSLFGFLFIPFMLFIKGIFTGLSMIYLYENAFSIFGIYSILLSAEIAILIIFAIQNFALSYSAMRNSNTINFDNCVKYFSIEILLLSFLAIVYFFN